MDEPQVPAFPLSLQALGELMVAFPSLSSSPPPSRDRLELVVSSGLTVQDIVRLKDLNADLMMVSECLLSGLSSGEILALASSGVDLYAVASLAGVDPNVPMRASHALVLFDANADLRHAAACMSAGFSFEEVRALAAAGVDLYASSLCRQAGLGLTDLVIFDNLNIDLQGCALCASMGASLEDMVTFNAKGVNLFKASALMEAGLEARGVLSLGLWGVDLDSALVAVRSGFTGPEVLSLSNVGMDLRLASGCLVPGVSGADIVAFALAGADVQIAATLVFQGYAVGDVLWFASGGSDLALVAMCARNDLDSTTLRSLLIEGLPLAAVAQWAGEGAKPDRMREHWLEISKQAERTQEASDRIVENLDAFNVGLDSDVKDIRGPRVNPRTRNDPSGPSR